MLTAKEALDIAISVDTNSEKDVESVLIMVQKAAQSGKTFTEVRGTYSHITLYKLRKLGYRVNEVNSSIDSWIDIYWS